MLTFTIQSSTIQRSWKIVDKYNAVWGTRNSLQRARARCDELNCMGQVASRPFTIIERTVEEKNVP